MELLIVITIIIVLAGLIIGTIGYVQKKAARSRAEAEIAAMSAACESYKADNGTYPRTRLIPKSRSVGLARSNAQVCSLQTTQRRHERDPAATGEYKDIFQL